jgi:hypothetical protein
MSSPLMRDFTIVLTRELDGLVREIGAFPDDAAVWNILPGVTNSAGNLSLHVAGNLQHFVGAMLGKTGYVRDRDAEFGRRAGTRAEVIEELQRARHVVETVLPALPETALESTLSARRGHRGTAAGAPRRRDRVARPAGDGARVHVVARQPARSHSDPAVPRAPVRARRVPPGAGRLSAATGDRPEPVGRSVAPEAAPRLKQSARRHRQRSRPPPPCRSTGTPKVFQQQVSRPVSAPACRAPTRCGAAVRPPRVPCPVR